MSQWKQDMTDILAAGRALTADELEEALAGALAALKDADEKLVRVAEERDCLVAKVTALTVKTTEMALWLGKIVAAFLFRDADKLAAVVGEYVKSRVKIVSVNSQQVH